MAKHTVTFEDDPSALTFCEALEQWHHLAAFVKAAVNAAVATDPNAERSKIIAVRVRSPLDTCGYLAQANYGLPDNYLGGGGGGKPPLIATDTSVNCPGLPPPEPAS